MKGSIIYNYLIIYIYIIYMRIYRIDDWCEEWIGIGGNA